MALITDSVNSAFEQARPAVMRVFKMVDLAGKDGIVSEFSPGVFLQVYPFSFELFILSMLLKCILVSHLHFLKLYLLPSQNNNT